jgi:small conductance mechanosensitive channel
MANSIKRLIHFALVGFLAALLTVTVTQPSTSQFSIPELGQSDGFNPPSEVIRLGSIEVATVHSPISGEELFRIASPTLYDRSAEGADLTASVERRAEEVNARLLRATLERVDPQMDPESLSVNVGILNGMTVITVKDSHYTQPLVLITVTQVDADYYGIPINELAEDWRDILETELRTELQQLTSEELFKDFAAVSRTLLGLMVITVVFLLAKHLVKRYQRRLYRRKKALQEMNESAAPEVPVDPQAGTSATEPVIENGPQEQIAQQRNRFLQGVDEILNLDRRLNVLSFIQWVLFWSLILIWYIGLYRLVRQFPFLQQYSSGVLQTPIELLGIWFLTGLAIRICRRLIDHFTTEREGFDLGDILTFGDAQRRQLRASTIAGAAKGLASILLLSFGILLALGALGLPTGSVLAIGSIFALAISFGSQSLVKDLVNGFLILAEDQFAIGDVIDTGSAAGLVENLNLRVTQLRSSDGELVTIPNSNITQVKNLTRSWSRVAFSIDVAYQTDPDKALQVLKNVAQTMYDEPEWHDKIVAEPNVLGIDSVSHSGMTITTWIETEPSQQWAVGREFRLRVRRALADHGIEIGTPRQTLAMEPTANTNGFLKDSVYP